MGKCQIVSKHFIYSICGLHSRDTQAGELWNTAAQRLSCIDAEKAGELWIGAQMLFLDRSDRDDLLKAGELSTSAAEAIAKDLMLTRKKSGEH